MAVVFNRCVDVDRYEGPRRRRRKTQIALFYILKISLGFETGKQTLPQNTFAAYLCLFRSRFFVVPRLVLVCVDADARVSLVFKLQQKLGNVTSHYARDAALKERRSNVLTIFQISVCREGGLASTVVRDELGTRRMTAETS